MKNQFVTYEIALKLKELGFDEPCLSYWFTVKGNNPQISKNDIYFNGYKNYHDGNTIAPLWQQVIDWLETKGYYINITRVFEWNPLPIKFLGWCIYIGAENPKEQLECNSYYIDHYHPTKQEAREQAILKCIELCQK